MTNKIVELNQKEIQLISGGITKQQAWRITQAAIIAIYITYKIILN